jgi:hypothetical protein
VEHHADFAVGLAQRLWLETAHDRPGSDGKIAGRARALALGWWVDRPGEQTPPAESVGTLYLVADEALPRPVWVRQADVTALRLEL